MMDTNDNQGKIPEETNDSTVGNDENPPLPPGDNPNSDGVTVDGDIDESVADDSDGSGDDDDTQATTE